MSFVIMQAMAKRLEERRKASLFAETGSTVAESTVARTAEPAAVSTMNDLPSTQIGVPNGTVLTRWPFASWSSMATGAGWS